MRYLILGQGGREHAFVRALKFSPTVTEIHCVPGSAGISQEAICHDVDLGDTAAVRAFVARYRFDVVVLGAEHALTEGLVEVLHESSVAVFGPNRAAADLEGSPRFAREFLSRAGVPLIPAGDLDRDRNVERLSVSVLTNGDTFQPVPVVRVARALADGDRGPQTEGMGALAPYEVDPSTRDQIFETIVRPAVASLATERLGYRGVFVVDVGMTEGGPKATGCRVFFGDPEAQVILPLLEGDWGKLISEVSRGEFRDLRWRSAQIACVVQAAPGYPENPVKGAVIDGDLGHQTQSSYFVHAATAKSAKGQWMVNGGRVLNAIGMGNTREEAARAAYAQANQVRWRGLQMRSDLGQI